ncbi:MAG: cytochrome oxidase biogenesis protein Surf1, facilitates heme A insertion [Rhodobacteraceae bacterium GWE1_64_9]|nr:MAG: cytochrome oxidase biogenesis protein Surf1, facilitates heme A insertion [Rhodobacteraceae bacterium GWE1_64_9]OHC49712.1 MAG: cytochrome oxidase biogenesis protein Surf1, facilitates heme A insertion [Rhodobacteraceae bacterium GWF1_65_7]HBD90909.1 SURF1 family protein [Gemmobacter sp.]HBU16374.1 SURF1 family protein [Gemmobacter sp.]
MSRRYILPLLFGLIGAAILIGLGSWQVSRLQWKQDILAAIEAKIMAAPVALPAAPGEADRYLPVQAEGRLTGEGLRVLASRKLIGAGYREIAVLETGGRRVMVDLGFVTEGIAFTLPEAPASVIGNLHWPAEVDSFTPVPDLAKGLWFARDVPAMAQALNTEPVLIIARAPVVPEAEPLPVDASAIPNDHLGYAITWFSLAAVWLGMTVLFLWRINRRKA